MACLKIALDYALTYGSLRNLKTGTEAPENGRADNIQTENGYVPVLSARPALYS